MTGNGPFETYETTQPWVVYTYLTTDDEADREGASRIAMQCCICGESEEARFPLPPKGQEPPGLDAPGYKHPLRAAFLAKHVHHPQRTAPETWVWPLRNPAAHQDTLAILTDVAEKAVRDAKDA